MSFQIYTSFFLQSKKKMFFDENIPGFSPYNGLDWEPTVQGPNESFSAASTTPDYE